jgi:hypothetical protein
MRSILAEYDDQGALDQAAACMQARGHTRITTYRTAGATAAAPPHASRLWTLVLIAITVVVGAYVLRHVGARPHLPIGLAPISFGLGVVAAGGGALLGALAIGRPAHASGGYWMQVEVRDRADVQADVLATDPVQIGWLDRDAPTTGVIGPIAAPLT